MDNNGEKDKRVKIWWQSSFVLFSKVSFWIFFPIIIAVFTGKWLDLKYNTEPLILISFVGIMFIFSMFVLIKNIKEEYKSIEDEFKNKK